MATKTIIELEVLPTKTAAEFKNLLTKSNYQKGRPTFSSSQEGIKSEGSSMVYYFYSNNGIIFYSEKYKYTIDNFGNFEVSTYRQSIDSIRVDYYFDFDITDENGNQLSKEEIREIIENSLDLSIDYTYLKQQVL